MRKKDDIEENDEIEDDDISTSENSSDEDIIVDDDNIDAADLDKYEKMLSDGGKKYKLAGMYKDWFLDYASYVILDRAVPHIDDGLKPVQRRILHAMKKSDDGHLHKVAGIIGDTMKYHPHGDASIKDALVQLGQKNYLIDCQGNWGNIFTGDDASAPRYIEARLSKFANEVVFSPKITEWTPSYDATTLEPVALPIKFPLLLAQGTEGIAVGMAVKILPHNFNELLDCSISALKGEDFEIYPDFLTGGLIDCSRYNDGLRGGKVKIRARINKVDKKTLSITEIPYGQTTGSIIDSIIKANDKGKIKIRHIDDLTSNSVEINIQLHQDISPDKTIDALYAFTNCEVSLSPNACVIKDRHPHFMGVSEILKYNAEHSKELFGKELEIRLNELEGEWHFSSLEKIFFEKKVYRILEDDAKSWEAQLQEIEKGMKVYQDLLLRPITSEDIAKLVEKPVRKISKFDLKAADEKIKAIEKDIKEIKYNLAHLTEYTIKFFEHLKEKYGANFPRNTEIKTFENIEAEKVVVANAKLYVDRAGGFVGTSNKTIDNAEYVCDCSDIAEVVVFMKDGTYIVTKVKDKAFIGKDIIHVGVFNRKDERTVYNVIYRDGKDGIYYAKRFAIKGVTRDKVYDLTMGTPNSSVVWFTANTNGEAEVVKIHYRPKPKIKKLVDDFDFASLAVKGRLSRGNIVTKNNVIQRIHLKSKGVSTLGGKAIWFDTDINRLSDTERGLYLGEFLKDESILVICKDGTFYTTSYDLSNKYQGEIIKIEKYKENKQFSALYFDGESESYYIKRFTFELNAGIPVPFISEAEGSYLIDISEDKWPQIRVIFGGKNENREPEMIDVEEFIGLKSYKAKGKRVSSYEIGCVAFDEPLYKEEDSDDEEPSAEPDTADNESDEEDSYQEPEENIERPAIDDGNGPTLF